MLWLILCCFGTYAQAHGITDSLQHELQQKQLNDITKLQLYLLLSEEIKESAPYEALTYAQTAIELASKTKNYLALVNGFFIKGIIYRQQGNYSFALDYLLKALEITEKQHLLLEKSKIERWIAIVYSNQKNHQQSIDFGNKSLHTAEMLRDRKSAALALSTIALTYLDKKDYGKAIYYFDKSIIILKTINEKKALADAKINLLNVYMAIHNYPKALELCNIAYQTYNEIDSQKGIAFALINFGEIYAAMDSMPQSLAYYHKALVLSEESMHSNNVVFILNKISELYFDNEKLTDAQLYAEKAIAIAKPINRQLSLKASYEMLYKIYKAKGTHTKALYYYELERQISDSLYNHERDKLLMNMHRNYEKEKQLNEIVELTENKNTLTEEVEKQTLFRNLLLVSLLFLSGAFYFVWHSNKAKRKANQELKAQQAKMLAQSASFKNINQQLIEQKAEIEELNNDLEKKIDERTNELSVIVDKLMHQKKEADEFAHIVSHNLRGPVATLKGLLGMYAVTDFTNDKEGLDQFMVHIEGTVKKLDIIVNDLNEILTIKESISKIYELIDLEAIVRYILEVRLKDDIENSEAIVKLNFCENVYFLAIRYYVENIVYQLISNAIKYKDIDKPLIIELTTTEVDSNEICLSVKDNGLGVPNLDKLFQLHQRQHLHVEGTGLGLYLVSTQMKSMGGRVDAISTRGKGAEFLVYFKRT